MKLLDSLRIHKISQLVIKYRLLISMLEIEKREFCQNADFSLGKISFIISTEFLIFLTAIPSQSPFTRGMNHRYSIDYAEILLICGIFSKFTKVLHQIIKNNSYPIQLLDPLLLGPLLLAARSNCKLTEVSGVCVCLVYSPFVWSEGNFFLLWAHNNR